MNHSAEILQNNGKVFFKTVKVIRTKIVQETIPSQEDSEETKCNVTTSIPKWDSEIEKGL